MMKEKFVNEEARYQIPAAQITACKRFSWRSSPKYLRNAVGALGLFFGSLSFQVDRRGLPLSLFYHMFLHAKAIVAHVRR